MVSVFGLNALTARTIIELSNSLLESVIGTDSSDSIVAFQAGAEIAGGSGNDTVLGSAGADLLQGNGGLDSLVGGLGNDILFGGKDVDTLVGAAGFDRLLGNTGDDVLLGGQSNDSLLGGSGNDGLYGGKGNDALYGGQGSDFMRGEVGNDILFGGKDNDVLDGGDGHDVLNGDKGNDTLFGGAGEDSFSFDFEAGAADVVTDFSSEDSIDLSSFTSIRSVNAISLTQSGTDVIMNLGSNQTVTFQNVDVATVRSSIELAPIFNGLVQHQDVKGVGFYRDSSVSEENFHHTQNVFRALLAEDDTEGNPILNQMMANNATTVITSLNFQVFGDQMDNAGLFFQTLRADGVYVTGSFEDLSGLRDESVEEISHLMHNAGISQAFPALQSRLDAATQIAVNNGIFDVSELTPDIYDDEYLAMGIDVFYGVYADGTLDNNQYAYLTPESMQQNDPELYAIIGELYSDTLDV